MCETMDGWIVLKHGSEGSSLSVEHRNYALAVRIGRRALRAMSVNTQNLRAMIFVSNALAEHVFSGQREGPCVRGGIGYTVGTGQ